MKEDMFKPIITSLLWEASGSMTDKEIAELITEKSLQSRASEGKFR